MKQYVLDDKGLKQLLDLAYQYGYVEAAKDGEKYAKHQVRGFADYGENKMFVRGDLLGDVLNDKMPDYPEWAWEPEETDS